MTSSAPARILAGGNAQLDGHVVNDKSQILVGGTLSNSAAAVASAVDNRDAQAEALVEARGTAVHTYSCGGGKRCYLPTDYHSERRESVSLAVSQVRTGTAVAGQRNATRRARQGGGGASGRPARHSAGHPSERRHRGHQPGRPAGRAAGSGAHHAARNSRCPSPACSTSTRRRPRAISSRPIRNCSLNQRQWLSSDYLLQALALDPALTHKRLGDGFYEQQLVREQVSRLTGQRLLEGYADDEAQYRALMNAGLTYAEQWQLRPGVALSAEQMAQLTSDIVWLVEQPVSLPDGSVQQVLVPQLYVRVKPGDLQGDGTLIAADAIDLKLDGRPDQQRHHRRLGASCSSMPRTFATSADVLPAPKSRPATPATTPTTSGGTIEDGPRLERHCRTRPAGRLHHAHEQLRTGPGDLPGSCRRPVRERSGRQPDGHRRPRCELHRRRDHQPRPRAANTGRSLEAGRDLTLGTLTESREHTIAWNAKPLAPRCGEP